MSFKMNRNAAKWICLATAVILLGSACSSPQKSQNFFVDAVKNDPIVVPIHTTALYTVFYDHALKRCVLHSAYTWGESGGGTGGTGLGVVIFACDPTRLQKRVQELENRVNRGESSFPLPSAEKSKKATEATQTTPTINPYTPPEGENTHE